MTQPHPVHTPRLYGDDSPEPHRLRLPQTGAVALAMRSSTWQRVDLLDTPIWFKRASCGLGCQCDAVYTLTDPNGEG